VKKLGFKNFTGFRSSSLAVKFLAAFCGVLVISIGVGMTYLVLDQSRQPYEQELNRLRAVAVQMDTVRDYVQSIQGQLSRDRESVAIRGTVPMVAALGTADLYAAKMQGLFGVRIASDRPRNPKNKADSWEMAQMEVFRSNPSVAEVSAVEELDGQRVLRYAMPVRVTAECMTCHGFPVGEKDVFGYAKEGYQVGDIRGLYSLYVPTTALETRTRQNLIRVYGLGLVMILPPIPRC